MIRALLHIHLFLRSVIFPIFLTASMRLLGPVSLLVTSVSMGLLVMIIGQKSVITMPNGTIEKQKVKLDGLNVQYTNQEFVKVTVAKLGPELEKKKTETDACKTEQVTFFNFIFPLHR